MNVGENNTVTISVEEYRKLLEIQARADILTYYIVCATSHRKEQLWHIYF